jgi:hypothetical protein
VVAYHGIAIMTPKTITRNAMNSPISTMPLHLQSGDRWRGYPGRRPPTSTSSSTI